MFQVNNAGIGIITPIPADEAELANFDKMMDVNVRSLVALTLTALKPLIDSKGTIGFVKKT